jgi:hypothetical protein
VISNIDDNVVTGQQFPLSSPQLIGAAHDNDFACMIEETADRF